MNIDALLNWVKNNGAWNRGKKLSPLSEGHKKKISLANKGKKPYKMTKLIRDKMSKSKKGHPAHNKGISPSEETRLKMSFSQRKKKLSDETKRKIGKFQKERWDKIGRKKRRRSYHSISTTKYKGWRLAVFKRDNFTCQVCGVVGGKLEAHHIKQWAYFPKLRYKVDNGLTLCRDCHKLKRKINVTQ